MNSLFENNYLIIPNFISSERSKSLSDEFRNFCETENVIGDSQAPNSASKYNYTSFLELLCEKTSEVSSLVGESVLPTYSYARVYKKGCSLEKHTDADACEISLSLHLDGDAPWSICIETPQKEHKCIALNPGDAIIYLGTIAPHWRDEYQGNYYSQVFLHYVRSKGKYKHLYFDKTEHNSSIEPMNYSTFDIFPVSIYVGELDNHEQYKKEYYKVHEKFDYEQSDYNNTVSENTGNPLIHLEDSLNSLFEEIINHTKTYVYDVLRYKEIFNFLITKTWISKASKPEQEIPWHIHSTSHISFCYYINCPKNSHRILFENPHSKNSLFLASTAISKYPERVMLEEQNQYNSETFFVNPKEGSLLLFPSSLTHCTKSIDPNFNDERLAIVGDITLVLQDNNLHYSMGYIDPKYWKMFV